MATLKNMISKEEYDYIINSYKNNKSIRSLAEELHHSRIALSSMLEETGVKTTTGNHYKYNTFNEDFFQHINSELKAYWLGFLYADGCIITPKYGEQEIKLALGQKDEQSIIDFKNDLESSYPIRYDYSKFRKNPNHQIQVIQSLRSQKMANNLKKLGCIERKSLTLEFPTKEQVPREYIWHFIRGYFDGDGSICNCKNSFQVSFVGTENFIKELYKIVQMGSILPDTRKENSWYLNIGGNYQVLKFCHKMYDDASRYMKRKYDIFKELLDKYDENQGI